MRSQSVGPTTLRRPQQTTVRSPRHRVWQVPSFDPFSQPTTSHKRFIRKALPKHAPLHATRSLCDHCTYFSFLSSDTSVPNAPQRSWRSCPQPGVSPGSRTFASRLQWLTCATRRVAGRVTRRMARPQRRSNPHERRICFPPEHRSKAKHALGSGCALSCRPMCELASPEQIRYIGLQCAEPQDRYRTVHMSHLRSPLQLVHTQLYTVGKD